MPILERDDPIAQIALQMAERAQPSIFQTPSERALGWMFREPDAFSAFGGPLAMRQVPTLSETFLDEMKTLMNRYLGDWRHGTFPSRTPNPGIVRALQAKQNIPDVVPHIWRMMPESERRLVERSQTARGAVLRAQTDAEIGAPIQPLEVWRAEQGHVPGMPALQSESGGPKMPLMSIREEAWGPVVNPRRLPDNFEILQKAEQQLRHELGREERMDVSSKFRLEPIRKLLNLIEKKKKAMLK